MLCAYTYMHTRTHIHTYVCACISRESLKVLGEETFLLCMCAGPRDRNMAVFNNIPTKSVLVCGSMQINTAIGQKYATCKARDTNTRQNTHTHTHTHTYTHARTLAHWKPVLYLPTNSQPRASLLRSPPDIPRFRSSPTLEPLCVCAMHQYTQPRVPTSSTW